MEFGTNSRSARMSAQDFGLSSMVDLNVFPNEWLQLEESAGSVSARPSSVTMNAQRIHPTRQRHSSASSSNGVSNSSVIDLEDIEDEIQMLSFSRGFPKATRRNQPVTLVLDEDLDIDSRRSAEQPFIILSSSDHIRKERSTRNTTIIDCELYPDPEDFNVKGKNAMKSRSDQSKAPTFTCPICMNQLVDASSTICGHIFCQSCIRIAIQKQQKCPTCRQKLNMIDFHRVYLPTTD